MLGERKRQGTGTRHEEWPPESKGNRVPKLAARPFDPHARLLTSPSAPILPFWSLVRVPCSSLAACPCGRTIRRGLSHVKVTMRYTLVQRLLCWACLPPPAAPAAGGCFRI